MKQSKAIKSDEKYITLHQAAALLHLTDQDLYKKLRKKQIPFAFQFSKNGKWIFDHVKLVSWISKKSRKA